MAEAGDTVRGPSSSAKHDLSTHSVPVSLPPTWYRHRPGKRSDGYTDAMGPEGCSCHRATWPHLPACWPGPEELR